MSPLKNKPALWLQLGQYTYENLATGARGNREISGHTFKSSSTLPANRIVLNAHLFLSTIQAQVNELNRLQPTFFPLTCE